MTVTQAQDLSTEPRVRLLYHAPSATNYTLILPEKLHADSPAPLIVALHFGGYTGPHYGRLIAEQVVAPAYDCLGGLIVAPDCPSGSWQHSSCAAAMLAVIDEVRAEFPIDDNRIVLTGYSMGGIGAWALSQRHPQLFSAAVIMAGRPAGVKSNSDWSVPLYVIHARDDELMAVTETEQFVASIEQRGAHVTLQVLDGVSHYETSRFIEPLRNTVPWLRSIWQR